MTPEETLEKAKAQGYNPDYDGPGKKTPEEFLAYGEEIAPIQGKRIKDLEATIAEMKESTTNSMKELMAQQKKMLKEQRDIGYSEAMKEINKRKKEAKEESDVDAYEAAVNDEKKLNEEKKKPEPEKPVIDPAFVKWHADNKWYKQDGSTRESIYADAIGKQKLAEGLTGDAFYKAVEKEVKLVFPELSGTNKPNIDESTHTETKVTGKKTYENLPKEAKKYCDMMVKNYGIKREEYVANYDWGE